MTFDARETADLGGQPILLLKFVRQTASWCYTTADRVITFQGQSYTPAAIGLSSIKQGQELQQQTLTLSAPPDLDVLDQYQSTPPADAVNLTIFGLHYGDASPVALWIGRIVSPKWTRPEVQISCEPISTMMRATGLRLRWGRNCTYALYGPGCGLNAADYAITGTLSAVSGVSLTADAFGSVDSGSLAGGYLEWTNALGILDRRSIDAHAGTVITVAFGGSELVKGLAVKAYPGCDHTMTGCALFKNTDNYGGCPNLPDQNLFNGSMVF